MCRVTNDCDVTFEPLRLIYALLRIIPGTTVVMGHSKVRGYPRIAYSDLLCSIKHVEYSFVMYEKKSDVTDAILVDSAGETMTFRG